MTKADKAALLKRHEGLIHKISKGFHFQGAPLGDLKEDLLQEGRMGLLIAIDKFDESRGCAFSTYAAYWIRARMMEFVLRLQGPVRLGSSRDGRRVLFTYRRISKERQDRGLPTDIASMAEAIGVSVKAVEAMLPRMKGGDIPLDTMQTGGEEGAQKKLTLVDEKMSPEEMTILKDDSVKRRTEIRKAIRKLRPREQTVVRRRYLMKPRATLAELGREFEVSRERVRQIEVEALAKLRDWIEVA